MTKKTKKITKKTKFSYYQLPKPLRERVEVDYLKRLDNPEREYLDTFNKEWTGSGHSREGSLHTTHIKDFNKTGSSDTLNSYYQPISLKQELDRDCNSRKRDLFNGPIIVSGSDLISDDEGNKKTTLDLAVETYVINEIEGYVDDEATYNTTSGTFRRPFNPCNTPIGNKMLEIFLKIRDSRTYTGEKAIKDLEDFAEELRTEGKHKDKDINEELDKCIAFLSSTTAVQGASKTYGALSKARDIAVREDREARLKLHKEREEQRNNKAV